MVLRSLVKEDVFPFSFKIPDRKMPSSFKSTTGRIVHKIKAELKQSMKITKKVKSHFTFVSKADMDIPGLMEPQYGCKDKISQSLWFWTHFN
ncbi:hypothetical protein LDENG_00268730 [Lucifuga dentata]|nr:hypothetical protein LDENG_00268730 [Lucifuga dentata]